MSKTRRPGRLLALSLALALLALCGCGAQGDSTEETVLWVVTEVSPLDGMNYQAQEAARRFEEAHENVTVQLELLPTDTQARELRLKQLRAMIPAGEGPDVYLLPTGNTLLLTTPEPYTATEVEALFSDVTQAMYNGIFADISELYDADDALGKDALNEAVMDAGVLEGARYVLPLRYNLPLLYTLPERYETWGLTEEVLAAGVGAIMDDARKYAYVVELPDGLELLPTAFDYEKEQLLLSEADLAEYMRLYQNWALVNLKKWEGKSYSSSDVAPDCNEIVAYFRARVNWMKDSGYPLHGGSLTDVLTTAYLAQILGCELDMLPLRTLDGKVAAQVAYYGAVGSGSDCPELGYEFLRTFLTEEFQWDGCRPRMVKTTHTNLSKDPQRVGLVEDGWPVRTVGSVAPLWDNTQYQYLYYFDSTNYPGPTIRCKEFQTVFLTDEDIPALNIAIDEVRFPIAMDSEESLSDALSELNDNRGNRTDADIDALAQEVHLSLWWHLAEG